MKVWRAQAFVCRQPFVGFNVTDFLSEFFLLHQRLNHGGWSGGVDFGSADCPGKESKSDFSSPRSFFNSSSLCTKEAHVGMHAWFMFVLWLFHHKSHSLARWLTGWFPPDVQDCDISSPPPPAAARVFADVRLGSLSFNCHLASNSWLFMADEDYVWTEGQKPHLKSQVYIRHLMQRPVLKLFGPEFYFIFLPNNALIKCSSSCLGNHYCDCYLICDLFFPPKVLFLTCSFKNHNH